MSANLTVTDLFAGAGGSSTGMIAVPGVKVRIAANHWKLACDVHNANHPNTDHATVDLHLEDPRYFPRTDLLWASPECKKWSQAGGSSPRPAIEEGLFEDPLSDEAATRSRLLMFDVLRFAEYHQYRAMVIENVVDIATQARYRLAWRVWQEELRRLGYRYRVVSLNSMHAQAYGAPAPQSRDRLYIVCWREGERAPDIDRVLRPLAWCPRCERMVESRQAWKPGRTVGRYRAQYVYVHGDCGTTVEPGWLPASTAIDWSLPGTRIGDRTKKPLAVKTRHRIAAGIARYWLPLMVPVEGRDGKDARPVDMPLRTMTTRAETGVAYPPFLTQFRHRVRDLDPAREPLPTVVSDGASHGVVTLQPFIAELRGGSSDARPAADPLATVTASGNHHALVTPAGGSWNEDARSSADPLRSLTTREAYALVTPYYGGSQTAQPVDDSIGTLTTRDRYALVMRNNDGGAEMTTPVDEVLRTLTTTGHQSLLTRPHAPRGGDGSLMPNPIRLRRQTRAVSPDELATAEAMVDDCLFRMLEPHEVAAAMAFPDDYVWQGNRRDRIHMAGNAVTPPAARDLIAAVAEALTGESPAVTEYQNCHP